jgi:ureidoglycolate lyase
MPGTNEMVMMVYDILAEALTPERSLGYCDILAHQGDTADSRDPRGSARQVIEIISVKPAYPSITSARMERHPTSAQAFIPLDDRDYLVVMCRSDAEDRPDLQDLRVLIVPGNTAIQYWPGIWHVPMQTVSDPGRFCVVTNSAGTPEDCEWAETEPFTVHLRPHFIRA